MRACFKKGRLKTVASGLSARRTERRNRNVHKVCRYAAPDFDNEVAVKLMREARYAVAKTAQRSNRDAQ
jgi:hypothetical protein